MVRGNLILFHNELYCRLLEVVESYGLLKHTLMSVVCTLHWHLLLI